MDPNIMEQSSGRCSSLTASSSPRVSLNLMWLVEEVAAIGPPHILLMRVCSDLT